MPKLTTTTLNRLHIETTYAVQAHADRVWVDPSMLLELVDAYQAMRGQPAFAAFQEQLARARRAEAELAELRMGQTGGRLLRLVEAGQSGPAETERS